MVQRKDESYFTIHGDMICIDEVGIDEEASYQRAYNGDAEKRPTPALDVWEQKRLEKASLNPIVSALVLVAAAVIALII